MREGVNGDEARSLANGSPLRSGQTPTSKSSAIYVGILIKWPLEPLIFTIHIIFSSI